IARIRVSTPHELSSALLNFDPGTDPKAISVSRFQANQEPVIAVQGSGLVQQQPDGTIVVGYHNVDGAVIVDITESSSAAYLGQCKRGPSYSSHFAKLLSIAVVMEQLVRLVKRICTSSQ